MKADCFDDAFLERYYIISVKVWWGMGDHTANQGPLTVGFAHSDLTEAEIVEALSNDTPSLDDIIAMEQQRRPVRKAGIFRGLNPEEHLKQGEEVHTKIGFTIGVGFNLSAWVRNLSGATLTTGTAIRMMGNAFVRRV